MKGPTGKLCARAGCRGWAMRGKTFCSNHRNDVVDGGQQAAAGGVAVQPATMAQWVATREACELLAREVSRVIAEAGRIGGLTEEIGALRLVQQRLLDEERDVRYLAGAIPRLVTTIVRALRAQHVLVGEAAGDLTEMLTRILNEFGVGDSED